MLKKKYIAAIAALIMLIIAITIFVAINQQKRYEDEDVFAKMAIWNGPLNGNNLPVYYFVIKNDGTLVSYFGTARSHHDLSRNRFMLFTRQRDVTVLSDQDFQRISEMVNAVAADNYSGEFSRVTTHAHILLLHNENIYGGSSGDITVPLFDLANEILRLSPLW